LNAAATDFRDRLIVGHLPLPVRLGRAVARPMQVEDRVHTLGVEVLHECLDGGAIAGRRVALERRLSVDPEPAVLIERHSDRIGMPGRDLLRLVS